METLSKLFGGGAKVKIMRLFLLNSDRTFTTESVVERVKAPGASVRRELATLESIGFLKRRLFFHSVSGSHLSRARPAKRRANGWAMNERFPHSAALRALLTNTSTLVRSDLFAKVNRAGKIKLLVISGILIQNPDSRVDLLVVGDNIREGILGQAIKSIEAEVGKELRYSVFDTKQFQYRLNIYDRLVRDVLDYPHETIVDRLGVSTR